MTQRGPQRIRPNRRRIALPQWAIYLLMVVFVLGVVGLGYLTFNGVRASIANSPLGSELGIPQFQADDNPMLPEAPAGEPTVDPEWFTRRVTVLVMGIDERESETGPWRTDTMILVTVDPASRTAGMISIPRDLWVQIPDYNVWDRINTANFRGDADQYPGGGGPALAMKTVQQTLGVPVDYYLTVNFNAFIRGVDTLGCVPITVPETIDDPNFPALDGYGYDPFYIAAGQQCLDGQTLLKYARTRATFGSDFDRAARQQAVLYAIRDHVLSTGQLPSLIAQAPELYGTIQSGIGTNLSLAQMAELARSVSTIPNESICSAVINGEYVSLATLPDGTQVLLPDRDKIRGLRDVIFSGQGECPVVTVQGADLRDLAMSEGATVTLLNGTEREGLATITRETIAPQGITITEVGNADRYDYAATIIYNPNKKDNTARYLAVLLGVSDSVIVTDPGPGATDIIVILGQDFLSHSGLQ